MCCGVHVLGFCVVDVHVVGVHVVGVHVVGVHVVGVHVVGSRCSCGKCSCGRCSGRCSCGRCSCGRCSCGRCSCGRCSGRCMSWYGHEAGCEAVIHFTEAVLLVNAFNSLNRKVALLNIHQLNCVHHLPLYLQTHTEKMLLSS